MENHFECLWDLFRSIPSLEKKDESVLDEFYYLNKEDPNYSICRATVNRGKDAELGGKFGLSRKGCMEIMKLFFTADEELYDKKIEDFFDDEVFESNFWLYWRTMFAFQNWHSALEMKLYFKRFIHHIAGLPDFSALKFTRYNQYESLIMPMLKYLENAGVSFEFNTEVTNVIFDIEGNKKTAKAIECVVSGKKEKIALMEDDFVFTVTITMHLSEMQRLGRADAGVSGKILQNRTERLEIPRNFVLILKSQSGNQRHLRHPMIRLFRILKKYVKETLVQEKLLQAVL